MWRKLLALASVSGLAVLLLTTGCKSAASQSQTQGQNSTGGAGSKAAPVEAKVVLPGLDGTDTTLEQYKGKVVLVNFWATWCQPCQIEIPWLIEFDQKYGPKGLVILGVSMDDEGKKVVEPWVRDKRFDVNGQKDAMSYRIILGSDKIAEQYGGLIGLPTSHLYSRDGKKVKTIIGLINHDDISKAIESQL